MVDGTESGNTTWVEGTTAGTATLSRSGVRGSKVQLIYIGSAENDFAHAGQSFDLEGLDEVRFGRGEAEDLQASHVRQTLEVRIPLAWVSGAHATLELDVVDGRPQMKLRDEESRNGTSVDGRRFEGVTPVKPGSVFEIGRSFWMTRLVRAGAVSEAVALDPGGTANPTFLRVTRNLARLAKTSLPVLLVGETGVGKRYLAHAMHKESGREGEFVSVNLLSVPLTDVLFGGDERPGLFARAREGTVYIEDIDSLDNDAQTKLSCLLSYAEGERRPGGQKDVRVIGGIDKDPRELLARGVLRADLYSRIAHYEAHVPALRERREDLGVLLRRLGRRDDGSPMRFDTLAFRLLLGYDWPFNIRQLAQALTTLRALGTADVTPASLREVLHNKPVSRVSADELKLLRDELVRALVASGGDVHEVATRTARELPEVMSLMEQLQLSPDAFRATPAKRKGGSTYRDLKAITGGDDGK